MRTASLAALTCAALLAVVPAVAQGPHADNFKAFNGTSLQGWRPQGGAEWRVANGEIVAAAGGEAGWLVMEKRYQDLVLRFAYLCHNCDAGVALRHGQSSPGTTSALYVALAGPDATTLHRIVLDSHGKELKGEQWFEWTGRQNPPGMQLRVTDSAGGWKEARIQIRGDVSAPTTASQDVVASYGSVAFRVRSGELRVKNVVVTDLLRPAAGIAEEVTSPSFRRVQLSDRFYSEGISAGDINRDGNMDALSGPYAYLGPDFKRAVEIYKPHIYAFTRENLAGQFTDNLLNYVHDFTGDGWPDYLKVREYTGAGTNHATLYVNPQGESHHWPAYQVSPREVTSETTRLADIDGDGRPELLVSIGTGAERVIGYLKPGADPTQQWTWVAVSEKGDWGAHGYGAGDLNGDGKPDIMQGSGWWAQPAGGAASGLWTFHPGPFGRGTDPFVRGADMFAYDVNGDSLPDIITSLFAHGPGLAWYEQQKSAQGQIAWKQHMIMDDPYAPAAARIGWETTDKNVAFTELHAMELADMDGDGVKDIITGKKWFSHGMEYADNDRDDPPVIVWFKINRKTGGRVEFVPHIINNYAGIGGQIAVADMNNDTRIDVLTAQRKGAYIFLNLGAR